MKIIRYHKLHVNQIMRLQYVPICLQTEAEKCNVPCSGQSPRSSPCLARSRFNLSPGPGVWSKMFQGFLILPEHRKFPEVGVCPHGPALDIDGQPRRNKGTRSPWSRHIQTFLSRLLQARFTKHIKAHNTWQDIARHGPISVS